MLFFLILIASVFSAEQGGIIDRSGTKIRLTEGESADIIFNDRQYTITVNQVTEYTVTVSIGDERAIINEGQNAIFDIYEGSQGGLMVEAVGLIGNDANLRMRKVERIGPVETSETPAEPETQVADAPADAAEETEDIPEQEDSVKKPLFIAVGIFILIIMIFFLRDLRKKK